MARLDTTSTAMGRNEGSRHNSGRSGNGTSRGTEPQSGILDSVSGAVRGISDQAQEYLGNVVDRQTVDQVTQQAKDGLDELGQVIRRSPMTAVACAAVFGLLLGLSVRR